MRRFLVATTALAVLAAGCSASRVSQDAAVSIRGVLVGPDGAPIVGQPLVLIKEADLGEILVGAALVAGTLGLVCLVDDPPEPCAGAHRTTSGPGGRFAFELEGSDTQGSLGNASDLHLTAALGQAGSGPSVSARFKVQTTELELPDLALWDPGLRTSSEAGRLSLDWAPAGDATTQRARFTRGSAGPTIWATTGEPPLAVDARVLEDASGTVAVEVTTSEPAEGTTVTITRRSAAVSFPDSALAPPSRGAGCSALDSTAGAGSEPTVLSPCPATDGDLVAPAPSPATTATRTLVVDLGGPRNAELVVVRGCPSRCTVETTADLTDWTPARLDGDGGFLLAQLARGTTVRAVRVTSIAPLAQLAEISIW